MNISNQVFKADAGKLQARLLFEGMPRSIKYLIAILSYGAQKYEAHSWKNVENDRYRDAKMRHYLDDMLYGGCDPESGLLHQGHEIINSLFLFEKYLDTFTPEEFEALLKYNKPPLDHKMIKGNEVAEQDHKQ